MVINNSEIIGSRDHLPESVLLGLLLYVTQKFVLRSPKARKLDARYAPHCMCQIVVIKNLVLQVLLRIPLHTSRRSQ